MNGPTPEAIFLQLMNDLIVSPRQSSSARSGPVHAESTGFWFLLAILFTEAGAVIVLFHFLFRVIGLINRLYVLFCGINNIGIGFN